MTQTSRPRAIDAAAGPARRIVLCFALLRALTRINCAFALAYLAGGLLAENRFDDIAAAAAAGFAALAALAGRAQDRAAAQGEARIARVVADRILDHLKSAPAAAVARTPRGALISGLQRWPAAIAGLSVSHRAATTMLVIGPLAAAAAIGTISIGAGLMAAAATPLLIVGFIALGLRIKRRAAAQEAAMSSLAGLFGDRVRAAPTLLANHAAAAEGEALRADLRTYSDRVMGLLRLAFLNAALIDLGVGLAIAFAAVLVGLSQLGLIAAFNFADIALWEALAIILIAPEAFGPLRRYAQAHHLKAEGIAALDAAAPYMADTDGVASTAGGAALRTAGLIAPYIGALGDMTIVGPALATLSGRSGAGKTTLLRLLAGVDAPIAGMAQRPAGPAAWIGTDAALVGPTAETAIRDGRPADPAKLAAIAASVGLDAAHGWRDGLSTPIGAVGEALSGGQRVRLSVARALYAAPVVVFADEPTAKLDDVSAGMVRQALRSLARDALVVAATHDRALIATADRDIPLAGMSAAA